MIKIKNTPVARCYVSEAFKSLVEIHSEMTYMRGNASIAMGMEEEHRMYNWCKSNPGDDFLSTYKAEYHAVMRGEENGSKYATEEDGL